MKNLLLVFVVCLTLGLGACVVEETPIEGEDPPPGSGSATETVAGVDADNDGLRDDVQSYVYASYSDPVDRTAAIQLAKSLQRLLINGTTEAKALTEGAVMNKAIDCLYSRDAEKFGDRVEGIEGLVVNTGARARAYARAGAFLSGGNFTVSTVANNAASCEVNP
jgi:hypothetical protein